MVRHDFECEKCQHIQEVEHGMFDDNPKVKCEKCGNKKMKKLLAGYSHINMNNYPGTKVEDAY